MPKRLLIVVLLALAVLPAAALAQRVIRQDGNVRLSFDGGFSPRALPRDRPAPVTVHVEGEISTTDGSHPPPLRRLEIVLNRNGLISTTGLPACTSAQLQSTTDETALARCGGARVGQGHFRADVAFSNAPSIPAGGKMLAFNGRYSGKRALLLHLFISTPVRTTFVLPLVISNPSPGSFGTKLSANIPTLAGGVGSVSEIDLEIGRHYVYRGQQRSYLSASCAAPAGFPGAIFSFARGNFYFADGRSIKTVISDDCKVR